MEVLVLAERRVRVRGHEECLVVGRADRNRSAQPPRAGAAVHQHRFVEHEARARPDRLDVANARTVAEGRQQHRA